jgi:HlyD family secretion protein
MNVVVKRVWFGIAAALAVSAGIAGIVLATRPAAELMQGQVDATEVDVAAKIPARVATLAVREGQRVARGDLVATLDSPEIRAKLAQAEAARSAVAAQRDKAFRGARSEEIRAARSVWLRAEHARELAEKTFHRIDRLHADGVVPAQRRDEAEAGFRTAADAEEAARAGYDMAVKGTRFEDKETAAAMVNEATGAVSEVEAYLADTRLVAPIGGEVYRRIVEPGELVAPGYSLVTIVDLSDIWVTFNVREDRLPGMEIGRRLNARIPALEGREVELEVYYVAPQGDFATWRATNAQGGFDLKTFEVRARPLRPVPGLRPGMSALVPRRNG